MFRCQLFPTLMTCSIGLSMVLAAPTLADLEEEHYDIAVWNDGGQLRTGGWDHDTETLAVSDLRVFEAHFGEDPEFPFSIDEPGVGGSADLLGLPEGGTLTLQMAAGLGVWNGSGFDASSASIDASYGLDTVSSSTGGGLDFLIADDFDEHAIFTIDSDAGDNAYILEFTALIDGFTTSESFWIVFNLGLDDEVYEEAVEWAEANYAPTPGAVGLLATAALFGGRRRRA